MKTYTEKQVREIVGHYEEIIDRMIGKDAIAVIYEDKEEVKNGKSNNGSDGCKQDSGYTEVCRCKRLSGARFGDD